MLTQCNGTWKQKLELKSLIIDRYLVLKGYIVVGKLKFQL